MTPNCRCAADSTPRPATVITRWYTYQANVVVLDGLFHLTHVRLRVAGEWRTMTDRTFTSHEVREVRWHADRVAA